MLWIVFMQWVVMNLILLSIRVLLAFFTLVLFPALLLVVLAFKLVVHLLCTPDISLHPPCSSGEAVKLLEKGVTLLPDVNCLAHTLPHTLT